MLGANRFLMSLFRALNSYRNCARRAWLRNVVLGVTAPILWLPRIATAENPYGLYVGGAVGEATQRSANVPYFQAYALTESTAFAAHDTGWKALIGIRPTSYVGAELEFIDFGSVRRALPNTDTIGYAQGNLRSNAVALFGVGYLPVSVPLSRPVLNVFAKAGVARYKSRDITSSAIWFAPCPPINCDATYIVDRTATRFAYGVGTQVAISAIAIRVEYERVAANGADADLLSLGLTWSF